MADEEKLEHAYASKYYDPVKAKEYYERTKKLKGRQQSQALSSADQKNIWNVSQDSIAKEKQKALDKESKSHTSSVESAKKKAEEARARITKALEERIANIKNVEIRIPENATPERRAFLEGIRSKRLAAASDKSRGQLRKLSKDLTNSLKTARETYAKNKQEIVEKFKKESESEKANIKSKVPDKSPKKK